ncbi:MAG: CHAD domain-containing protein [Chthoniobacterales bacterium]
MSFKIRNVETIGESVRRIIHEQIKDAITASKGEQNGQGSPVHQTRKHLKKARAALRLLAPVLPSALCDREDRRLRTVGRLISDIRDAEVRLETVKQLREISALAGNRSFEETEELLAFELDSFLAAFANWREEAAKNLLRTQDAVTNWHLPKVTRKQICQRVSLSYKCGRRALKKAAKKGGAKRYHELRKQAKQLWYQIRILRPLHPAVFCDMADELKGLGERLGHAHDLHFLGDRIEAMVGAGARTRRSQRLAGLIDSREKDLYSTALALAERFYAEPPNEFAARIAGYFRDWERVKRAKATELLAKS